MVEARTATSTVLLVGAASDDPVGGLLPSDLVDGAIRPTVLRFGGRIDGSYGGVIVASFSGEGAARSAAEDLTATADWAFPEIALSVSVVPDGSKALPSAAAVTRGARSLKAAGTAVPLGGAGIGAIVLWRPGSTAPEAIEEEEPQRAGDHDAEYSEAEVGGADEADVAETRAPDLETDGVLVFAANPEHLDLALDSLARFDAAGLELPEGLQIYFHGEDAPECQGHTNRAFASHGGEFERIDMCVAHDMTLRHELAHVWAYEHLGEDAVGDFLDMRGLEDWTGNPEWAQNGSEQAAHIIAWGLADRAFGIARIPDADDFGALSDAFEVLTGIRPLHDRPAVAAGRDSAFSALDLIAAEPAAVEPAVARAAIPDLEPIEPIEPIDVDAIDEISEMPVPAASVPADEWDDESDADEDDDDDEHSRL
jgi:hypothetical protein